MTRIAKFEWTITPNFTRLNNSISSYGVGRSNPTSNSNNYWKLNFDLQDLAMKSFKRENFDIFIAVSPVGTSEDLIATSPAFMPRNGYWAGNWIGGDYWRDEQKWFYPAHEFGHYVLGLDDFIIVNSDDVIMICPKDKAQDVKKIVNELKAQNKQELL